MIQCFVGNGGALFLSLLPLTASATPPLLTAAEVVGVSIEVFVKPGAITLIQGSADGTQTALRPLVSDTAGPVPPDLSTWTRLRRSPCLAPATFRWKRHGAAAVVRVAGTWEEPMVEVLVNGTVVAMGRVGRPARICALHAQDLDAIPGEEIVVLWQTSPNQPPSGANTLGVSLLRIPETAQ
jgi:hypothetical protein